MDQPPIHVPSGCRFGLSGPMLGEPSWEVTGHSNVQLPGIIDDNVGGIDPHDFSPDKTKPIK